MSGHADPVNYTYCHTDAECNADTDHADAISNADAYAGEDTYFVTIAHCDADNADTECDADVDFIGDADAECDAHHYTECNADAVVLHTG